MIIVKALLKHYVVPPEGGGVSGGPPLRIKDYHKVLRRKNLSVDPPRAPAEEAIKGKLEVNSILLKSLL